MNLPEKQSAIEKQIIRAQKSAKTLFPMFNRPHNWLRMKNKIYYAWHMLPIAGITHYATLGVYTLLIVGLVLATFNVGVFQNPAKADVTNIWTFDTAANYTYDSNKIEFSNGIAQAKCEGACTPGTDWVAATANGNSSGAGWSYRKSVTVASGQVSGSLTDFPVLVSFTNNDFRTIANGGHVGKSDGSDIVFTSSDKTTTLNHELEKFTATTGEVVAWVKAPTVATGTVIYIYYGNSTYNGTLNANKTSVWDSNYKAVWHVADGTTLSGADSTSNANTLTSNLVSATTGKTDGGASFPDSVSQYLKKDSFGTPLTSTTYEAWIKPAKTGVSQMILGGYGACHIKLITINASNQFNFHRDCYSAGIDATSTTVEIGQWYHVVLTISAGGVKTLYVNGQADGTNSTATGTNTADVTNFRIGSHVNNVLPFSGSLDEIRVSTTARSAEWITAQYNNQNSPSTFATIGSETQLGYPTDYPTLVNNTAHNYVTLPGFAETLGSSSTGTIKYQISPDNGVTWYWYSSGWTTTANASGSAGYANANTAADINTNIATFTAGSGTRQFKWRAFFASDGTQLPRIDTIALALNTNWDITSGTSSVSDESKIGYVSGVAQLIDLGGGTYATDTPYVTLQTGQAYSSISAFIPTLGSGSTGTIKYQLSPNGGTTWYYNNAGTWATATTGTYAHTNTSTEINQYVASFNDIVVSGTKSFKWRAYLSSNGSTTPKLDSAEIYYYTPPTAPTAGSASPITTTSITWNWTDQSTYEGQFKVIDTSNNSVKTTVSSTSTGTTGTAYTYEESGLSVNTQYSRIVKSTDGTEDSSSSSTITAYTLANTPSAPTVTSGSSTASVILNVNSNPSNTEYAFGIDNDSSGSIDTNGYVQTNGTLGATAAWQTYTNWGGATGLSVTGLTPNTTNRFMVKARNGNSTETAFSSLTSNLHLAATPAAPTVTAVSSTSLKVVINENSNPATVEYAIWNDTAAKFLKADGTLSDTAIWQTKANWGGASGITNSGLTENTSYTYKVKSRNSANTETALGAGTTRATPIAPTPPSSVTIKDTSDITKVNNFELSLQWEAVSNAGLDYYIIERSTDAQNYSQLVTLTNRFYRDTNLSAGNYYYRVKTHTETPDTSAASDVVSATVGPDSTAPSLSNVTATAVSDTKAVITWVTDENATSKVEYGSSTAYGNDMSDSTLTGATKRRHTVTLTGLTANTSYHFRAISTDGSSNTRQSDDAVFTTTDSPVDTTTISANISEVKQSSVESDQVSSSAEIVWATGDAGDSFVEIGPTDSYGSVYGQYDSVTLHTVIVSGLQPNTTYHYRVRSTTAKGKVTVSADQTLITGSVPKPTITDVQVSDIDLTGATISWKTPDQPATTQINWGTSEDKLTSKSTEDLSLDTNHRVTLKDLKSGVKYHFRVVSRDIENNATYQSVIFTFETVSAPRISSVKVESVNDKQATMSLATNTDTDIVVSYYPGSDSANAKKETTGQFSKTHTLTIKDLKPNTTYTARLQARDKYGNTVTSDSVTIQTTQDNFAPEFTKITTEVNAVGLGDSARAQAIVATTLNEPSTKMTIRYGLGIAPNGSEKTLSIEPGSNYGVVIVKDLPLASTIHYRVEVEDLANNKTQSEWKSFPTPQAQASIINIIVKQLTDTFGIFNFGGR